MTHLAWKTQRNLENSLAEFLQDTVTSTNLTIPDENGTAKTVSIRVGSEFNSTWGLPVITAYVDTKNADRLSIGSNKRLNIYLVIIDIRTLDKGSQLDLTEWLQEAINDGFDFYEYYPNPSQPSAINKTKNGYVSVDFVSNIPLRLGENAELLDKYRQNITLSCYINK